MSPSRLAPLHRPSLRVLLLAVAASCAFACYEEKPSDVVRDEPARRHEPRIFSEAPPVFRVPADAPPTPLAHGFESLLSLEQVAARVAHLPHEVMYDHEVEARGTCEGSRATVLRVGRYEDLGHPGKLQLHFFDGKLWSTRFGPKDLAGYLDALERERGIALQDMKRGHIEPATDAWVPPIPPLQVTFSDERLAKELDSVEKACRYQIQLEKGLTSPAQAPADAASN